MFKKAMRRTAFGCAVLFGAIATLSVSGSAHHSTAMFKWGDSAALQHLTIERWEWTNPHTFLYARDSDGTRWAFEGMSPNHLVRYGWSHRTLQPGQVIDLTYYPLRDGRNGGFSVTVTLPNGQQLSQLSPSGARR